MVVTVASIAISPRADQPYAPNRMGLPADVMKERNPEAADQPGGDQADHEDGRAHLARRESDARHP